MTSKHDTLIAAVELGAYPGDGRRFVPQASCTARDLADLLGISLEESAVSLLRCHRSGLLERRRLWCRSGRVGWRRIYHYRLSERGEERLLWYEEREDELAEECPECEGEGEIACEVCHNRSPGRVFCHHCSRTGLVRCHECG